MTPEKTKEAFNKCFQVLQEQYPYDPAIEMTNTRKEKKGGPTGIGHGSTISHLKWMCVRAHSYIDEGRMDKAMRWLGFVQGALWMAGLTSIYEMADWNRPALEELFTLLDKTPLIQQEEGDYWEEDENGVMFLRRKNGSPIMMMSRADFEEMKKYKPGSPDSKNEDHRDDQDRGTRS